VGEIADFLKVDSLAYLELDRLVAATTAPPGSFCTGCLSGDYPVPVPDLADAKLVLEKASMPAADELSLDDDALPVVDPDWA